MPKTTNKEIHSKQLKIKHTYPETLETKFATNIIVQHQPDYFILSFFENLLPAVLGETEDDKKKQFDKIKFIESKCLSRIILTPEKMKEVISVLNENYKKYEDLINSENESI